MPRVPASLVPLFTAAKWLTDRHTSTLEQAVLTDFIHEGHCEQHLRRMRTYNAARRAVYSMRSTPPWERGSR